jgi:NADH-quinone oxidoreductase subunit A
MASFLRTVRNKIRCFHRLPSRGAAALIFLFFCGESSFKPALREGSACLYCTREITPVRPVGSAHALGHEPRDIRMEDLLLEYLPILIFIGLAAVLGSVLIVVPLVVAPSKPDPEKLSAYECGFPAFGDARMKFDVRFYLVAILFIIFDLEVAFLFPWAITLGATGIFGFVSMMIFLGVLTVGFIYEWKKGALEWE